VILNAISQNGCEVNLDFITGGLAAAYYNNIPSELIEYANGIISREMAGLVKRFYERFGIRLN